MLVEKLEILEKKIRQQRERLQQREFFLREQKRKALISKKIALGSLFFQAGLDQLDEEALLGALLFLKEKSEDEYLLQEWKQASKDFKRASKKPQDDKQKTLNDLSQINEE